MKVSKMIKNLQEFMEKYGDLDCWYARDDEGNGYQQVYFDPTFSYVDDQGEVYNDEEDLEYCDLTEDDVTKICIVN